SHNMKDASKETIINRASNDTLSRTIMTSATVFLTLLALFIFGGWRENILPFINPLHALAVTLSGALLIHLAFRFPYPRWQRAGTAAGIPEKRAFRPAFNGNPAAICWRSVRLSVCTRPGKLRSRPNSPYKHGHPTI
ncbi:MAG: hypothetical protein ACK2UP_12860, partial [Candidatus Promineifilaceae bacterium]